MKKPLKISLLFLAGIVIIGLTVVLIKNQPKQILFYSNFCGHCLEVEKYINENKVKDYLAFRELEVSQNQMNSRLLSQKAAICGVDNKEIGVPFFFDGEKCLIGSDEIINYFESKK